MLSNCRENVFLIAAMVDYSDKLRFPFPLSLIDEQTS